MSTLLATGYNSRLRPAHTKTITSGPSPLLFVLLERLPDDAVPTYAWSRFRVTFVGDMELDHLVDFFDDEGIRRLVPRPDSRAPVGDDTKRLTIFLSSICFATTPSTPVNYVAQVTLSESQVAEMETREDWRDWFKLFVQQTCGQPLSLPTSPETQSNSTPS